jgi:hypothetical protein
MFPEQKQLYYTVECEVLLGATGSLVVEQAEAAVDGFSDRTLPHWAFGDEAGAHTNLALARLHSGDLDGAADAVRPVLDLGPSQRNRGIVVSARRVQAALSQGPVGDAVLARELREEIAMFDRPRHSLIS